MKKYCKILAVNNLFILKEFLPISIENEGVIMVQFQCIKFILLCSLVGQIMPETATKNNLSVVMDVTANLGKVIDQIYKTGLNYVILSIVCLSFRHLN